ncbi:MAG: ComF family protein [Cytophagales bacterium]|nr:ComF family protein [Rhizobacter sp.]
MLFSRLLQHVPSQCAVCRGWGTQAVCEACTTRFAVPVPRCERCALQVPSGVRVCGACLVEPPAFDSALAGLDYAHPWSALITQFKFHAALDLVEALATPLLTAQRQRATPLPQRLLPVPLSPQRLRERGFNQAWELTRRVARALDVQADAHLLLRMKDSPHQLALPPEQRAANVRGVFAVEPLRRDELCGLSVAVIDDVMTTGATLSEIARVLKQAGAVHVEAWALARTPRPT